MHSTVLVKLDYQTALVKLRDMQSLVCCKFMVILPLMNDISNRMKSCRRFMLFSP